MDTSHAVVDFEVFKRRQVFNLIKTVWRAAVKLLFARRNDFKLGACITAASLELQSFVIWIREDACEERLRGAVLIERKAHRLAVGIGRAVRIVSDRRESDGLAPIQFEIAVSQNRLFVRICMETGKAFVLSYANGAPVSRDRFCSRQCRFKSLGLSIGFRFIRIGEERFARNLIAIQNAENLVAKSTDLKIAQVGERTVNLNRRECIGA